MGIFSKFRENAVECSGGRGEQSERVNGKEVTEVASSPGSEKGLIKSVGEMLQHSAHNVKEAVFGHMDSASDGDTGSLPRALALEDPFSQSDHVLAAVVEHDVRLLSLSDGNEEEVRRKTIVQTVRENLSLSAHIVRDAVLNHTAEPNGSHFAQATTPIEDGDNGLTPVSGGTDDHRRTIIEAMGDIMSHPVQTVKDIIGSHSDVVESSPIDPSTASSKQVSAGVDDLGKPKEHEEEEEVKGLIQTVKDAAQEVKEEVMEVVQEVKDVVMSNDTLPNVQTGAVSILSLNLAMSFVKYISYSLALCSEI